MKRNRTDHPSLAESDFGNGDTLLVDKEWNPKWARLFEGNGLRAIRISPDYGQSLDDIGWLSDLKGNGLVEIEVFSQTLRDLSPLHDFPDLRVLSLDCPKAALPELSAFDQLEHLRLTIPKRWHSPLALPRTLQSLILSRFPWSDLTSLAHLDKLRSLDLDSRTLEDLSVLPHLPALTVLSLYNTPKLRDFAPIAQMSRLEVLGFDTVKGLDTLDFLQGLKRLRHLHIANCGRICSLAPLAELTALESFGLVESRLKDMSLAALTGLPRLRALRLPPNQGYRPPMAQVQQSLAR